ncbi:hypothetical protein ACLQ25_03340 [Micromonospora sp. DT44]|uniref:hypothetical protein n=1 Tax=Micromonospora sp. DT44 TaxID=3393439 RepID=UPI003CFB7C97
MTPQDLRRFGFAYLVLWFAIFGAGMLVGDDLMVVLVDVMSGIWLPLVVVLSWLPFGSFILFLFADSARVDAPPMRQPWLTLVALSGLVLAGQVPTIFRKDRRSSDAYRLAAHTPVGEALVAGLVGSFGAALVWTLLFQSARWLRGRISGQRVPFLDNSWGMRPRSRRVFGMGAAASVLIGLGLALAV